MFGLARGRFPFSARGRRSARLVLLSQQLFGSGPCSCYFCPDGARADVVVAAVAAVAVATLGRRCWTRARRGGHR